MTKRRHLDDVEIAILRRRRAAVRASHACEGLRLSAAAEALFERFDRERLPMEEREAQLIANSRARRAVAKANAAE